MTQILMCGSELLKHGRRPSRRSARRCARSRTRAFSLVELLIVMGIIMTLAAMAIPKLVSAMDSARTARAVGDIRALDSEIALYEMTNGFLPATLADIGRANLLDPWGTPYQYLNFSGVRGRGSQRKDRFLVPINSTYDLYSMGPDRRTTPPLTSRSGRDDIIRASDGAFIGIAVNY